MSSYTKALLEIYAWSGQNIEDLNQDYGKILVDEINLDLEDRAQNVHAPCPAKYRFRKYIARRGQSIIIKAFDEIKGFDCVIKVALPSDCEWRGNYRKGGKIPMLSLLFDRLMGGEGEERVPSTLAQSRFVRSAYFQRDLSLMISQNADLVAKGFVLPVYEIGDSEKAYFTMPFLTFPLLLDWLAKDRSLLLRLQFFNNLLFFIQNAFHEKGLVHSDLKPENIFVREDGYPIVIDLGICKNLNEDVRITQEGVSMGAPLYRPPEMLLEASRRDYRSDIYLLGILLWIVWHQGEPDTSYIKSDRDIIKERIFPDTDMPFSLRYVFLKATEADKALRYQDLSFFRRDFAKAIKDLAPTPPPVTKRTLLFEHWEQYVKQNNRASVEKILKLLEDI